MRDHRPWTDGGERQWDPDMVTLACQVVVPAPVAQTAAFVLNLANDRTWRSEVISMELDPPGPVRVGQRIVDRMRFGVLPLTVRAEAVAAEPTSGCWRNAGTLVGERAGAVADSDGPGLFACAHVLDHPLQRSTLTTTSGPAGGWARYW